MLTGARAQPATGADSAEYRKLVLDNGLRVILLSDENLNVSSAAMAVGVGSLSDPENRQGLAHFLEHMLFLGTEKYPAVADYGFFIKTNGGYSNALHGTRPYELSFRSGTSCV